MKNKKYILIIAALLLILFAVPVWGRAGGGGSSGGGGGGSSSGGGSYSSHSGYYRGGRGSGIAGMILQSGVVIFAAGGGSIVLIRKARAARARSRKAMAFYAQLGDNWDYREVQRQVEETYFQVQECWRRMDISYGAPYLSQELMEEFDSKIQWMQVRGEAVVQKNVKLLSAMPVYAEDNPGEEYDMIWYLIHGKMIGYYIDTKNRKVIRGNTRPEAFFEYWKFVYRGERWVLQEIRQKEEMDIDTLSQGIL